MHKVDCAECILPYVEQTGQYVKKRIDQQRMNCRVKRLVDIDRIALSAHNFVTANGLHFDMFLSWIVKRIATKEALVKCVRHFMCHILFRSLAVLLFDNVIVVLIMWPLNYIYISVFLFLIFARNLPH